MQNWTLAKGSPKLRLAPRTCPFGSPAIPSHDEATPAIADFTCGERIKGVLNIGGIMVIRAMICIAADLLLCWFPRIFVRGQRRA